MASEAHRSVSPETPSALPGRHERRAPRWDGSPRSMDEFLDEFEELCRDLSIPQERWIDALARYAPNTDSRLMWKALAASLKVTSTWADYRKVLIENTPGAGEDRRYTKADLDELIATFRAKPMQTRLAFNEYWQRFYVISEYLFTNGRLSLEERSRKLLAGLPPALQRRVKAQLRNQYPIHHPDDPFTVPEIFDAVKFTLTATQDEFDDDLDIIEPKASSTSRADTHPTGRATTKQVYDGTPFAMPEQFADVANTFTTAVKNLSTMMETLSTLSMAQNGSNTSSSANQPYPDRGFANQGYDNQPFRRAGSPGYGRPGGCIFCADPGHFMRECRKLEECLTRGRCIRNEGGMICYPDGSLVTARSASGNNMSARVDNWHYLRPAVTVPVAASNVFDIVEIIDVPAPVAGAMIEEVHEPNFAQVRFKSDAQVEDIPLLEALVQESQRKLELARSKRVLRSDTRQQAAAQMPVPTRAAQETTKARAPETPSVRQHIPVTFAPAVTPEIFPSTQQTNPSQQFQYIAPIEDQKIVDAVLERSLSSSVTLTTHELLAIAPEIRKNAREKITSRRIPTSGFLNEAQATQLNASTDKVLESFTNSECLPRNDDGLIVARDIETLRTVEATLDGWLKLDAILDDGSQIIGIRRGIWEELTMPIRSDKIMTMESANQSRNESMGLLANLKVTICSQDFYLQAQVMDNASYDVLLGRPFHTLTQAAIQHFNNGKAHATITNPNNGAVITIPTKARIRQFSAGSTTGFLGIIHDSEISRDGSQMTTTAAIHAPNTQDIVATVSTPSPPLSFVQSSEIIVPELPYVSADAVLLAEIELAPQGDSLPITEFELSKHEKVTSCTAPVSVDPPPMSQFIHESQEGIELLTIMPPPIPPRPPSPTSGIGFVLTQSQHENFSRRCRDAPFSEGTSCMQRDPVSTSRDTNVG